MMSAQSVSTKAFSRTDLLFCIAFLGIFSLLSFASLARSSGDSRWLVSMSNMKQLTAAWLLYANDHGGRLVLSSDGGNAGKVSTKASWAGGWLNYDGQNTDNTNTSFLVDPYGRGSDGTIRHYGGLLGLYLRDPRLFASPNDASSVAQFGVSHPRARSVSMNFAMMGPMRIPSGWQGVLRDRGYRLFTSLSDIQRIPPASAFVLVTENPDSMNDGHFIVDVGSGRALDLPSSNENGGANLSFADGHVENWLWRSSEFRAEAKGMGYGAEVLNSPAALLDLKRLEAVTSSK